MDSIITSLWETNYVDSMLHRKMKQPVKRKLARKKLERMTTSIKSMLLYGTDFKCFCKEAKDLIHRANTTSLSVKEQNVIAVYLKNNIDSYYKTFVVVRKDMRTFFKLLGVYLRKNEVLIDPIITKVGLGYMSRIKSLQYDIQIAKENHQIILANIGTVTTSYQEKEAEFQELELKLQSSLKDLNQVELKYQTINQNLSLSNDKLNLLENVTHEKNQEIDTLKSSLNRVLADYIEEKKHISHLDSIKKIKEMSLFRINRDLKNLKSEYNTLQKKYKILGEREKLAKQFISVSIIGLVLLVACIGLLVAVIHKNSWLRKISKELEEKNQRLEQNRKALENRTNDLENTRLELEKQKNKIKALYDDIAHRVKNSYQRMKYILDMQAQSIRHKDKDGDVVNALKLASSRILTISTVHKYLYTNKENNIQSQLEELTKNIKQAYSVDGRKVDISLQDIEPVAIGYNTMNTISLIIHELLTNSIKHAFEHTLVPTMKIFLKEKKGINTDPSLLEIIVEDNGTGLPDNFDLKSVMKNSFGIKLIKILIDDGDFSYERLNPGTRWIVTLVNKANRETEVHAN